MIYSDFVSASADLLILLPTITNPASATPSTDPNFNTILPRAIEYAEQRMYRELDLMQTVVPVTATCTANVRTLAIPSGVIVINSAYCISPSGLSPDASGATRNLMLRTTIDSLNFLWPQSTQALTGTSIPKYFATQDDVSIVMAPAPDSGYTIEFNAISRPAPLSASNTSTILTTYLPDVFLACSMIFFSGYQRDFGMQSDDPKMAISWEAQYQGLKASATEEISRAKSQANQWQPFSPPKVATATTRGQ